MANYLTFPMEFLNITQTYNDSYGHRDHTTGSPKDYPVDCAGRNTGKDYFLCPCDEVEIKRIYGVGNGGTNTLWMQSTSRVNFADGTQDFCCILVIHPNDDDLRKLYQGQKFRRGAKMFREGTDGNATGNHIHLSVGKGKIAGNGWVLNSRNKWVLTTTNGTLRPENAFFIDRDITTIVKTGSLNFKNKPQGNNNPREIYTVKSGDTLWEIAEEKLGSGTRYDEIMQLNNLSGTIIYVGQKLEIPER